MALDVFLLSLGTGHKLFFDDCRYDCVGRMVLRFEDLMSDYESVARPLSEFTNVPLDAIKHILRKHVEYGKSDKNYFEHKFGMGHINAPHYRVLKPTPLLKICPQSPVASREHCPNTFPMRNPILVRQYKLY